MTKINQINTREFQEKGSVGSNVIRRVEVWGVDPHYVGKAGAQGIPITLCRDSTGYMYQVLAESAMGTSAPQPGEIWLINRTLGLWTFMARISIPSPITQTLAAGVTSYNMQPCNRLVMADVPDKTTVAVTLPNPITAIQDEAYGVRNLSGGGTKYSGIISLIPFNNEAIHGPTSFGAHAGGDFVTDNKDWFCIGETTTSGGNTAGSGAPPGPQGPTGATGPQGPQGVQGGTGTGLPTTAGAGAFPVWNGSSWVASASGTVANGQIPYGSGGGSTRYTAPLGSGNQGLMNYWDGTQWNWFANGLSSGNTGQVPIWQGTGWGTGPIIAANNSPLLSISQGGGGVTINSAASSNYVQAYLTGNTGALAAGWTTLNGVGPLTGYYMVWFVISIFSLPSACNIQGAISATTGGVSLPGPSSGFAGQFYGSSGNNIFGFGTVTLSGQNLYLLVYCDTANANIRGGSGINGLVCTGMMAQKLG